jgi:beta-lactamase class A
VRDAARYAGHRHGRIAFAVRTPGGLWGRNVTHTFPSASVLKPMLLVAYLGRARHRPLHHWERALLSPMIRRSDNAAAGRVLGMVGARGLRRVAHRAGMTRFRPVTQPWGLSRIDASDQTRFFLNIDRLMPARHRAYGMRLLATVVQRQRWGIGRVPPPGWRLYFKGGWGSGTGWVDHQVALLTRGGERVSVAVLTQFDGSHAYGKATLRGIMSRLLRGLAVSP